jgi:hypothetical protein
MEDECQLLDVNVDIGTNTVYKAKIFCTAESSFVDTITEALQEYARATFQSPPTINLDTDDDDADEDDPITCETFSLLGRIVSVKCIGRRDSAELFKFIQ